MTREPFPSRPDPDLYIPRQATDAALLGLAVPLVREPGLAALLGPQGSGKSVLLGQLAARARRRAECTELRGGGLGAKALKARLLENPDLRRTLERMRQRAQGGAAGDEPDAVSLVLVDDAHLLPDESTRLLAGLWKACRGAVRICLAGPDDERIRYCLSHFGSGLPVVRLDAPLTLEETAHYLERRLEWAQAPAALRALLDPTTLEVLHSASGGNPGALHTEIRALTGSPEPAPDPAPEPTPEPEALPEAELADPAPPARSQLLDDGVVALYEHGEPVGVSSELEEALDLSSRATREWSRLTEHEPAAPAPRAAEPEAPLARRVLAALPGFARSAFAGLVAGVGLGALILLLVETL